MTFCNRILVTFSGILLGSSTPSVAWGQEAPLAQTRAATIESERATKQPSLRPEEPSKVERWAQLVERKRILERLTTTYNGFGPKIGNMITGGGFAIGPVYRRDDLGEGKYLLDVFGQVSTRGYLKGEAAFGMMKLLNGHATVQGRMSYRNYSGVNYYGPGPDSEKTGRSNYRLEDTSADVIGTLTPIRHVNLGGSFGKLWTNVGPGQDDRFISSDRQYSEATTPGLTAQSNFLRTRVFVQYDTRDFANGPKSGTNIVFMQSWFSDRGVGDLSFKKTDIEVQQFIPFLNKTHRIALRAKGSFADAEAGSRVPFFLGPILGGSDDLRGFRPFRFYDRNMVVYNAEYQWEVFAGLEGALFFDAGKVMPEFSDLRFSKLETSAGFGLRFNARNSTFLRLDLGFSHEGYQIWFKFNDLFNSRKFASSVPQPLY